MHDSRMFDGLCEEAELRFKDFTKDLATLRLIRPPHLSFYTMAKHKVSD